VQQWRLKRDLVPIAEGNPTDVDNEMVVTPTEEGTFQVICTELCGLGHATMRAEVVVESEAEFQQWISEQQAAQEDAAGSGGRGRGVDRFGLTCRRH